jgi:hypothetical protein
MSNHYFKERDWPASELQVIVILFYWWWQLQSLEHLLYKYINSKGRISFPWLNRNWMYLIIKLQNTAIISHHRTKSDTCLTVTTTSTTMYLAHTESWNTDPILSIPSKKCSNLPLKYYSMTIITYEYGNI